MALGTNLAVMAAAPNNEHPAFYIYSRVTSAIHGAFEGRIAATRR